MKSVTYWGNGIFAFAALGIFNLHLQGGTITEDFNDSVIDPTLWILDNLGTGPTTCEVNHQLELTLPGTSRGITYGGSSWVAGTMSAGVRTDFKLVGDFDIRVQYDLISWPSGNGARSGIGLSLVPAAMERTSFLFDGDYYLTHFYDGIHQVATADQEGALRLVRSGSMLSGYYLNQNDDWVLLHTGSGPSGPAQFAMSLWSHDGQFLGQDVRISLDNVVMQFESLVDLDNDPLPKPKPNHLPDAGSTMFCLLMAWTTLLKVARS